jgi:hypothetical protein
MEMVSNEKFKKYKKAVEYDLKNYPYWLIAVETPELGYPTKWNVKIEKSSLPWENGSSVENNVLEDIRIRNKVNIITSILTKLDSNSKKIIEEWYFRDTSTQEELMKELDIDKNKFYYYRNRSLKKFMIALRYV